MQITWRIEIIILPLSRHNVDRTITKNIHHTWKIEQVKNIKQS